MPAPRPRWWRPVAALVVIVAVVVYANSLDGALFFDDTNAVVSNAWVHAGDPIAIVTQPSWWNEGRGRGWRPVTTLSFAADYAVHGLTPRGYHLVNVALHAGVSLLVLAVFARATAAPRAAAIAALLFAAHPVHTEAVASVVGRAELLAALGFFASWLFFLAADGRRGAGSPPARRAVVPAAVLEGAGVAVFFGALLAKENVLMLLPVLVLADLLAAAPEETPAAPLRRHAPRYVALGAAGLVFVLLRGAVLGPDAPGVGMLDNPLVALPPVERVLTAVKVVGLYAWRLLVPITLAADYSYDQVTAVRSLLDLQFLGGVAAMLGVVALGWWTRRRAPAVALGAAVLVTTFAIVSNLIVPIGTIMAERLVYLPSAGFCLIAGALLDRVATPAAGRRTTTAVVVLVAVVVALYGVRTWTRNRVWREPLGFFSTMVADAPRSARSHRELGNVLAAAGRMDEARGEFERSLAILPRDGATLYNLGNALLHAGDVAAAIDAYNQALAAKPDFADAMVNLGNAESLRGDQQAALGWMRRALVLTPRSSSLHMNVANTLFRLGEHREARAEYETALALAPAAPDILTNYGAFLLAQGEIDAAIGVYERAVRTPMPMAFVGLAAAYRAKGMNAEAARTQARAEELFPANGAVRQMGEVLRRDAAAGASPRAN